MSISAGHLARASTAIQSILEKAEAAYGSFEAFQAHYAKVFIKKTHDGLYNDLCTRSSSFSEKIG